MFALVEVALIYFDFFIENMGLLISADQLSAQNISFGYDEVILFLQFLAILFTLFDDLVEFFDLFGAIFDLLFFLVQKLFVFAQNFLLLLNLVIFLAVFLMFFQDRILFLVNFFFQLGNLVVHDLILLLESLAVRLGFSQIFGVNVTITAHRLVQALLLFQLCLSVHVFLLKLGNQVIF